MILGIRSSDGSFCTRPNVARWDLVSNSAFAVGMAALLDGTIVAVSEDTNSLKTKATLDATWIDVPNSGTIYDVAVMNDGTIVGARTADGQIVYRAHLDSPWDFAIDSSPVVAVTTMLDGRLLGISQYDLLLCYRENLREQWLPVADSGPIGSVTMLDDGTILAGGAGDHQLKARTSLDPKEKWQTIPYSGYAGALATLRDGSILTRGGDGNLYHLPELMSTWTSKPADRKTIGIAVLPQGRILGVGDDFNLYFKENIEAAWVPANLPGGVRCATTLPDGTLIGVSANYQLVYYDASSFTWKTLGDNFPIRSVTSLSSGVLMAVGRDDHQIYRKPGLFSGAFTKTVGFRTTPIATITTRADDTLLGVAPQTGVVYTRPTMTEDWMQVPGTGIMAAVAELPDGTSAPSPDRWLLQYTSSDPHTSAGDGRPWGDETAIARRAGEGGEPWDTGSLVTPLIGGYETMNAIRDAFEAAIIEAGRLNPGPITGPRGVVNIVDWQFNGLRDLSVTNAWGGTPWQRGEAAARDQTALGLVLRMMSAGILVRLMLWNPTQVQGWFNFGPLTDEHRSVAAAIQDHDASLRTRYGLNTPLGLVLLDKRTATPYAASLHQKMITVQVGSVNVAFCGGIDLAYTRRSFGTSIDEAVGIGDWQSGEGIPIPNDGWPKQTPPPVPGYPRFPYVGGDKRFGEDLPAIAYGARNLYWHDQHLKLEGPIVGTLERQFAERWIIDTLGKQAVFNRLVADSDKFALVTDKSALRGDGLVPLPQPTPLTRRPGAAAVQMWRTIPVRADRMEGPFLRGEFTVMDGIAKAVRAAGELITIWDQYMWHKPLARLLADRLTSVPSLRLLIVLPPYGTGFSASEMALRREALSTLYNNLDSGSQKRVRVYDAWNKRGNVGIYVHAKVQTYDDALLVAGSANLNVRSFECDAELDCAVLHRPTVRHHLAGLYRWSFGKPWTDFTVGWLTRYWQAFAGQESPRLIPDPFFNDGDLPVNPRLPNGVTVYSNGNVPLWVMEPSSLQLSSQLLTNICQFPQCVGDPRAYGRLDEVTFLLERCHNGSNWYWRKPY